MKLQEFIDRDFGGNISNFAKAYGVTRQTVYNILSGATFPQTKLRESLKRKGVRFDKQEEVMTIILNFGKNEYADFLKNEKDGISHTGTGTAFLIVKTKKRIDGGANVEVQALDDDSPAAQKYFNYIESLL